MARYIDLAIPDPAKPDELIQARAWQRLHTFAHGSQQAVVAWDYYRRDAWATPGAIPIRTDLYRVEPYVQPEEYAPATLLTAAVPAVYGDPDPETGVHPLISPAVDATYQAGELLRPEVPSYAQLFGELAAPIATIADKLTTLAATYYGAAVVEES